MSPLKVKKSRDDWKNKAKARNSKVAHLKKTSQRQQLRAAQNKVDQALVQRLLRENEELRSLLAESSLDHSAKKGPLISRRVLCILILIRGIISFRSVPRILKVFQPLLPYPIKIPHFTSVIHWTLRAGVAIYNQVTPVPEPWVALIDCSIDIGTRKALVIMRVPLRTLRKKASALGLQDCECVGLEISPNWNGKSVSEALERIFV